MQIYSVEALSALRVKCRALRSCRDFSPVNVHNMNFVAQVEEHLRDLGAEARKKHPGKSVMTFMDKKMGSHLC
jgi:hypothetical protein